MPLLSDLFGLPGAGQPVPIGGLDGGLPEEMLRRIAAMRDQGPIMAQAQMPQVAPGQQMPPITSDRVIADHTQQGSPYSMGGMVEPTAGRGTVPAQPQSQPQTPAAPPQQPQQPQQQSPAGPTAMDRLQGFVSGYQSGGLLGGIAGGSRGVDRQVEAENLTVKALMQKGVDETSARAAVRNPALAQQIITQAFSPSTQKVGPGEVVIDKSGRAIFDNSDRQKGTVVPQGATLVGPDGKPQYTSAPKPRELSPSDLSKLREEGSTLNNLKNFTSTFRDAFAGKWPLGELSNWAGGTLPESVTGKDNVDMAQWWRDYRRNNELTERHALFGAALTPGEQQQWRNADIHPNMSPQAIKDNLDTRRKILENGLRNYANGLIQSGYDAAPISAALGVDLKQLGVETQRQRGATSIGGGATSGEPVKVQSFEEALKLKSGTEFITPDGRRKVRP